MGKRFPIQDVGTIPLAAARQAYRAYAARHGEGQTLEQLAERGGFGLAEFAVLYMLAEGVPLGGMFPRKPDDWSLPHVARCIVRAVQLVDQRARPHEGEWGFEVRG